MGLPTHPHGKRVLGAAHALWGVLRNRDGLARFCSFDPPTTWSSTRALKKAREDLEHRDIPPAPLSRASGLDEAPVTT